MLWLIGVVNVVASAVAPIAQVDIIECEDVTRPRRGSVVAQTVSGPSSSCSPQSCDELGGLPI